jgi:hypothetical protein
VLQQISAAQSVLDKVALALVDRTVHGVPGADPDNQEEKPPGAHVGAFPAGGAPLGRFP